MDKRLLLCENSTYNSKLLSGTLAFMFCILGDIRLSEIFGKETLVDLNLKVLKKVSKVNFSALAANMQQEMEKIYPFHDYTMFRQEITKYLVMENMIESDEDDSADYFSTVSNEKVIKYLDQQLYSNILGCIYDMLENAKKQLSLSPLSKIIKIGEKTCKALYPDSDISEAMGNLAYDISMWINYNYMLTLLDLEMHNSELYLKVKI